MTDSIFGPGLVASCAARLRGSRPDSDETFDAVFVGSGINSLVGAALLAKVGWRVAVLERDAQLGGAIRTRATEGGFTTELMSCFHLQFLGTPAYRHLREDLERHGLRYANTDAAFAVLTTDRRSLVVTTDRARNVERLDELRTGEGRSWNEAMNTWFAHADDVLGIRGLYPWSTDSMRWALGLFRRRGAAGSRALVGELLKSARDWLTETFEDPLVHALLAPWALHGATSPDDAGSAVVVRAVAAFSELLGAPVPVGGGKALVAALAGIIEEAGGTCLTGMDVDRILVTRGKAVGVQVGAATFRARRAVACSVTPSQLYKRLLGHLPVPDAVTQTASRFRAGPAGFQIAFSLDRVLRWDCSEDLSHVGVVNIADGLDAVSRAANEGRRGLLPAEPTICCGQPMALDPTRGPAGYSQLWVQLLEVPPVPTGDAAGEIDVHNGWSEDVREAFADRVQRRLAYHLPGLDESIVDRIALSPVDLEAANINLVGGSVTSGAQDLDQMLLLRPSAFAPAPRTFVRRLYHIGASTHPGASLSGSSGQLLAGHLLQRAKTVAIGKFRG